MGYTPKEVDELGFVDFLSFGHNCTEYMKARAKAGPLG